MRASFRSTSHLLRALCGFFLLAALAERGHAAAFRYSSSSDRIYVEGGGTAMLSDIKAALPNAPLMQAGSMWTLSADLFIEDGTTLRLVGTDAGGDVDELRLRSDPSRFVQMTADHGTFEIRRTLIRSWNPSVNAPDTDIRDGRAFIRVRSRLAADGRSALESRMDVIDSEISHLGYNASETQGLVWKVLGSMSKVPALFDLVQVRGDILRSFIHHNYYGVYTYGHQSGQWIGNEVAHNIGYGIDPHDDSDDLLIEDNYVHHNGNHGIIASKRCNNVVIRNNRSWDNVGNGVMLHRSSDDGLVENNDLRRNTDSGVAIFASLRSTIRGNLIVDSGKAGMRFSNGAAESFVENNEISGSGTYGFYFYKGSDVPEPGDDGRPKRNAFVGNVVLDGQLEAIKLTDSDETLFLDNSFTGGALFLRFHQAQRTELSGNQIPSSITIRTSGSAHSPSSTYIERQPFLRSTLDDYSQLQLADYSHAVFDVPVSLPSVADGERSEMLLTAATSGYSTQIYTRAMQAVPSVATVEIWVTSWKRGQSAAWLARLTDASDSVQYRLGDLSPGAAYIVRQDTRVLGTFTADAEGRIAFGDQPGTRARLSYTIGRAGS